MRLLHGFGRALMDKVSPSGLVARLSLVLLIVGVSCLLGLQATNAQAQDAIATMGSRGMTAPQPADLGFVESANGVLHLEIPLGTVTQRPAAKPVSYRLVYDSSIWQPYVDFYQYVGGNALNWGFSINQLVGGWQAVPIQSGLQTPTEYVYQNSNYTCFYATNFSWPDYSGTTHFFPISTQSSAGGCSDITSGAAYATDSSGYYMSVTNYTAVAVWAPDGTLVYNYDSVLPRAGSIEDSNGNYFIYGSPWTDTIGRAVPSAVTYSTEPSTLVVPSSTGNMTYTMTYAQITVKTGFGQSGVTEYNGTMPVLQKVGLPDGSSYQFKYDCDQATSPACGSPSNQAAYYGEMISVTLPTLGQISYGYTNFTDSYSNKMRWLNTRTSSGGTWTYTPSVISTCTSTQVGCQQKTTVTKPSGDYTVQTFVLDNGALPTQTQNFDSHGNLLATTNDTWDLTNACPLLGCYGHSYVRKLSESVTLPVPGTSGNITKQAKYTSAVQTGLVSAIQEWRYQPGTSPTFSSTPDRATYTTYTGRSTNQINLPASVTICNSTGSDPYCTGGGGKVAQTLYTYDSYGSNGLTPATGFANHDDTNFGTTNTSRGNATQVSTWVSGSNYLTTNFSFDTTGQITQVTDPKQNTTQYSYTDNFLQDGSIPASPYTPSKPTNAYVTTITSPPPQSFVSHSQYYYGSGQMATSTDPNGQTTFYHFIDPLSRPTHTLYPIGWNLTSYTSPTQIEMYSAVGSTSPTGCTSCTHTELDLDTSGRRQYEVQYLPGMTGTVYTTYDTSSRVQSVSHTYTSTSDPNYVFEQFAYVGMDRAISDTHPDGQLQQTLSGTAVTANGAGGLASQLGSPTTYGYGYPTLSIDETGKLRQSWLDGFGRTIEVDVPMTASAAAGTGSATTSGTEQVNHGAPGTGWITISGVDKKKTVHCKCCGNSSFYDWGVVSLTVNGVTVQYDHGDGSGTPPDTSATVAAGLVAAANGNPNFPAIATVSGSTITLVAKQIGTQTDYTLSSVATTDDPTDFPGGSWTISKSGSTLTGGQNNTGAYDTGTVWVTVNGFQASVSYGQGSTSFSLASALANIFNTTNTSPVIADLDGALITLEAKTTGSGTNYTISSGSSTNQPTIFTQPSFAATASGSTLVGGTSGGANWVATEYTYDAADNLTSVFQDPQTRTFVYDGLGRRTSTTTPEAGTVTIAYAQTGGTLCAGDTNAVCQRTDARGITTTHTYDAVNRTTQNAHSDGITPTVTYTYDQGGAGAYALGRLTSMSDGTGSESYTYNPMGWITQMQKLIGSTTYTMGYTYNAGGELTQITYPSGRAVSSCYDNVGRLSAVAGSVGCATNVFTNNYGYSAGGQTTGLNYANGVVATLTYPAAREQLGTLSYTSGTQTLFSLNYSYQHDPTYCPNAGTGNNGQIQCVTDNVDSGRTASYAYDGVRRLTATTTKGSTNYPAWGLQWNYDNHGNRLSQALTAGSGPTNSLSFDPATNRPSGYTYDFAGNMTVEPFSTPRSCCITMDKPLK